MRGDTRLVARSYDRTVKLRPGETVLLVDGDDELFVEQMDAGVLISDARGARMRIKTERMMGGGAGVDRAIVKSRSRA